MFRTSPFLRLEKLRCTQQAKAHNEIAALAGRNVLNGAGTFLAMHGLYHTEYHEDFRTIYETPAVSADLIRTYDIDYIEVSSWERASYAVDENYFRSAWPCIFDNGEIQIYQINP